MRENRSIDLPPLKLPPQPCVHFGCLQPDADGRWYFPIYIDGVRSGKFYTQKNHFIIPEQEEKP